MSHLRDLDEVKVNKSGRFSPDIIRRVNEFSESSGLTFSRALEELTDIGLYAIGNQYKVLSRKASVLRKPIGSFIIDAIKEGTITAEKNETI
jgi:hypothetical protein